jgi:hypothetical protein
MHSRTSLVIALACTAALMGTGAQAQSATEVWRLGNLQLPESVIFDSANNRLIVGNMVAFGPEGGDDGYLSIVSPEGQMLTERWATGLKDPKGMAIVGDRLFVADMDGLAEVSLADGAIVTVHALPGAQFPNDVTTDGTDIFVSDFFGHAIFRISNGSVENWLASEDLQTPNGLLADGDRLIVGAMGKGMKPDFTFESAGGLLAVDMATKAIAPLEGATEMSMTDGVARMGDMIIFSDNPSGTIYAYADGAATAIATIAPGAADLWVEGDMIYVPMTPTGELVALRVE